MKSRQRPPLVLTEAEQAPETNTPAKNTAETAAPVPAERPLSERRRRKLAEERAQVAARTETKAEPARADTDSDLVMPQFSESADAPPAAYDPPSPPVPVAVAISGPSSPPATNTYLIAWLGAALWMAGIASWGAFEYGAGRFELEPLRLALLGLIALAPAGLAILLAHAVRQGSGLAAETRRAHDLAQALLAPTALAARQTGEVLTTLRQDIDQATLAAERARNDMTLLRQALAEETHRLNEAAESAGRTARRLVEQLGKERDSMSLLGDRLDTQALAVTDAVERQSRMVVDASDLAQTQLREAEAALAARAADLAAAAGEAQDAARLAADDLARQTLRLENAGSGVAEQIQSVEEGLGQQRAALVAAAFALRTDQEDFSAQVESQRAQLTEQLSATRTAAGELDQVSTATSEGLKDLIEAATDQFRALVELSQREADGFDNATRIALDRFEALAAQARDALVEETRRSLEALQATAAEAEATAANAADQAQVRAERLGEALFDAAQKADAAADARIDGARKIVHESADLVDEAGERTLARLETTMERMNAALARMEDTIVDLDERAALLPEQAQARVDAVRASVEEGLAALAVASRKAAEDTEALDASFQDRVRRNYEMLTEAVRLMGVVSGDPSGTRRREAPSIGPRPDQRSESRSAPEHAQRPGQRAEPAPPPVPNDAGRGFGLRGRLRLEPTPSPAKSDDRLDWSDLEGPDRSGDIPLDLDTPVMPPMDSEALSGRIFAAIRRMGVDPNALLPRSRVEEAAMAIAGRDPDRARQIVRRVAPAAVRSVSRRVLSDPELKHDAEQYVREFARSLADYSQTGDGLAVMNRLSSDGGRAFMLLDAAVGDLA
ncbi:tipN [Rhizobium sp. CRIBSB]|nr:tipN [Rhizobium sp. CRIBSB]